MAAANIPRLVPCPPRRRCTRVLQAIAIFASMAIQIFIDCREGLAQPSKKAVILRVSGPENDSGQGLLTRELVRQALLIAARDEMGLATRDASLREDVQRDSNAEGTPLEISVSSDADRELLAKISKSSRQPSLLKAFR